MISRRAVLFVGFCFFLVVFLTARTLSQPPPWHKVPQAVGMGELVGSHHANGSSSFHITSGKESKTVYAPPPHFIPGTSKPLGSQYTKMLVIPRTKLEDVTWIEQELPDWSTAIYVADDPKAPLHPPKNKGHEVMVYLSYCIDYYDDLPDVSVFMHSHQFAWHNDVIFGGDAAEILRRLSLDRVTREGYMNTRCTHGPGCPDWMHPGAVEENEDKQEEVMLARAWSELFPDDPVPPVLAQPCCAQFALSRDRIRTIPRSRFVYYRDWMLQTDLSDYIAGRIWEYLWQYVFTGNSVVCVEESVCLCDGYGVCFGSPAEYQKFANMTLEFDDLQKQLDDWISLADNLELTEETEPLDETMDLELPPLGRKAAIQELVNDKERVLNEMTQAAMERGQNPKNRALEAGRPWKEGDGF
ncbi:uncharacterized protein N7459_002188 [Penicillium hispanicum]|uniref:uncharacterized protein n=1 Tax=Penicillium hispanicum TaxID=1080232 RepID=UPI00254069C5|nr:uncharacterized protein N7459_002188 [Penicillium hispanicum]KAJ5591819.1 hypothetical protein N7459_002188 [Penicillium hispanicum]